MSHLASRRLAIHESLVLRGVLGGLALVALLLSGLPLLAAEVDEAVPWGTYFYADGRQVVAESTGQPVLFRGIAAPGMEYAQSGPRHPGRQGDDYTTNSPALYARLAAQGFNVVRVPFDWGALVSHDGQLNQQYLAELDRIVNQYAAPHRLYVILDMHSYLRHWDRPNGWTPANDDPALQALLVNTWRRLAEHYVGNSAVLGYEIMNEPNPDHGDSNWPAIAQRIIDAIRDVDRRHLILVDGRYWSSSEAWPEVNGPQPFVQDAVDPPRLVYVPHVYFNPANNDQYQGVRPDLALLDRRLAPMAEWSRRNAVPVWIGESGVPNTPEWAAFLDCAFARYYNPLGWGHLYWEAGEWSRDLTRLGPLTLATLQRHLGRPAPLDQTTGPTCADLAGPS